MLCVKKIKNVDKKKNIGYFTQSLSVLSIFLYFLEQQITSVATC